MNKELINIQEKDVKKVFYKEGGLQVFVDSIEKIINEHDYDLTTTKGKDAIKSLSASVSRSKTYLDGKGKDLVAGVKAKLKIVDQNRKSMRDQLDILRDKARQPLTDYEEEQKAIAYKIQETLSNIERLGMPCDAIGTPKSLEELNESLNKLESVDHSHVPESLEAESKLNNAKSNLASTIEKLQKEAEEKAELERLRAEEEDRKRKEAEALAEKQRIEREEQIAKEAAEQAEREKIAAEERAKRLEKEKVEAEERAKKAEKEAKERAEKAAEEAKQAEIRRQKEEEERKAEERRKIEANKKHIGSVRKEIKEQLMSECKLDEPTAKKVVLAMVKMDRVTINY